MKVWELSFLTCPCYLEFQMWFRCYQLDAWSLNSALCEWNRDYDAQGNHFFWVRPSSCGVALESTVLVRFLIFQLLILAEFAMSLEELFYIIILGVSQEVQSSS